MNQIKEYFGNVISVYTEQQGIEDGILMQNPSKLFMQCDLITSNLWHYIESTSKEPAEILDLIMRKAKITYKNERFKGDNDRHFFVIQLSNMKHVWFVRNERNKLTAMLPEDY